MAELKTVERQKLKLRVEQALTEAFEGMLAMLDNSMQGGQRIGGIAVWDGFDGLPQLERQQMLSRLFRSKFTQDEQSYIGLILTITSREQKAANISAVVECV